MSPAVIAVSGNLFCSETLDLAGILQFIKCFYSLRFCVDRGVDDRNTTLRGRNNFLIEIFLVILLLEGEKNGTSW